VEVNPAFAARFAALGLDTAAAFLDLPGEVVGGHPDRHVARIELPGGPAFYLKREHAVGWRERLRNRRAGFGWASRSAREAAVLRELEAGGLSGPRWAAAGEDGRGRAFLLVEEVAGAADLRHALGDTGLSPEARRALAARVGGAAAAFHAAGLTTPDLVAKHVLVNPAGTVTVIDWPSARRAPAVAAADRVRALAALHASVADRLATTRERLRVLWAALRHARRTGAVGGRFSDLARRVEREADGQRKRRSVRDQRQSGGPAQRLVWLAGEQVCVIPELAADWPRPAVAAPFYGCEPGTLDVRLPDGRAAVLVRGRAVAPLGRLRARLRGRPWRSPGVTLGRVLFHLDRYGVPAPRLLAFGQRLTGPFGCDWFALHTPPDVPVPPDPDEQTAELVRRCLGRLHDAGCRPVGDPHAAFGLGESGVSVRDAARVRIVRRLTPADRAADHRRLAAALGGVRPVAVG
jgi:tRNA A-37 threonylcarbamoyl transferase component Bud32